jgi:hypothetical protein
MRMTFCPECGRQRTTSARYCGGCGRDFGVAATADTTELAAGPAVESPRQDLAAEPPGRGRGRPLWIVVAVIVLLAVGGGAFAVVRGTGNRSTALPGGHGATATARATAPAIQPATTLPASLQASSSPSASASASASPFPSATPTPSVSPSVVSLTAGVKSASAQVEIVLSHYFQGINRHDYAEYASSQTAAGKADQPQSSFDPGYATTVDSGMTLTSLAPTGDGDLTATVRFTSRQSPSDSVDGSACNGWVLNLYLVPSGTGYLITPAPPSYEPSHTDC